MGKQRRNIADIGSFGIIRESLNLLREENARTLFSVYISILVPCTIINIAFQQFCTESAIFRQYMGQYFPDPSTVLNQLQPIGVSDAISKAVWRALEVAVVVEVSTGFGVQGGPMLAITLLYLLVTILTAVFWTAPILAVVASSFTSEKLEFDEVLTALSHSWKRVLFTGLWGFLGIVVILSGNYILAQTLVYIYSVHGLPEESAVNVWATVSIITTTTSITLVLYWTIVLQVSYGVAALELSDEDTGDYRWHALSKGLRFLDGRRWTASGVFAIYSLLGGGLTYFGANFQSWDLFYWDRNVWIELLLVAIPLLICPFFTLMNGLSMGLVYASCKALHHESILDHPGVAAAGFGASGSSDRLLGKDMNGAFQFDTSEKNGNKLCDALLDEEAAMSYTMP